MYTYICDPLSENPAHHTFIKIEIRLEVGISMYNCVAVKKIEAMRCLAPEYCVSYL